MKTKEKLAAVKLRKKGYSLKEIVEALNIAKSSASEWVRNIPLSKSAEKRLLSRISKGQLASQKAKRIITAKKEKEALDNANLILSGFLLTDPCTKILCSMIYYCEGEKSVSKGVSFTNSDPNLVSLFLHLFRKSFSLDESKLRVCVHLHSYHNPKKQLKFWSKTTNIPLKQFIKPYLKPSSGMYKKEGYAGCVNIRYGDVIVSREIKAIALQFMERYGPIG